MLNRTLGTLVIIIAGLNAIYIGCKESGADNRFNPVWGIVSGFVTLERYLLFIALAFGIGLLIIFLIAKNVPEDLGESPKLKRASEERLKEDEAAKSYRAFIDAKDAAAEIAFNEAILKRKSNSLSIPENIPIVIKTPPEKPKPDANELKQKAIRDILRR